MEPIGISRMRSNPTNIPEHIDIDVTNLKIGDTVKVADLPVTDRHVILTDPGKTLVVCAAPTKEETAEVAPEEGEEAAAEPEVLKKGKGESEEEAEKEKESK